MKIVPMPGDGRCMQHSVAYHLKSDVRVVMNRLHDFYKIFGHTRMHVHEKETWADWIRMEFDMSLEAQQQSLQRRWGGTLDLLALARIFQRDIHVYLPQGNPIVIQSEPICADKLPIAIRFNGSNHYDALVH